MFGFFKKQPKLQREDDRVYLTRRVADNALVKDAQALSQAGAGSQALVIGSFFPAALERIRGPLSERGLRVLSLPDDELKFNGPAPNTAYLLDLTRVVSDLRHRAVLDNVAATLLVVEHHPHPGPERSLLALLEEQAHEQPKTLRFYAALDDRFFALFAGERAAQLVAALGLPENECLTHSWITSSIRNAQKKLERRVPQSLPAESEEDWFRLNMG